MSHLVQHSHFTQLGDRFKITVYAQTSPCVIAVSGRLQGANGHLANFQHLVTVSATGLQTVYRPASGEYWIMSCVVSVASGTVNLGDVLVKVELVQGDPSNVIPHDTLVVGSPDNFIPVTMGSPGEWSVDGRRVRQVSGTGANPAVNGYFELTVPAGVRQKLIFAACSIQTVPVTGNAYFYMEWDDDLGNIVWEFDDGYLVGPGVTAYYYGSRGGSYSQATAEPAVNYALGDSWIYPGGYFRWSFYNSVGNVQMAYIKYAYIEEILGY